MIRFVSYFVWLYCVLNASIYCVFFRWTGGSYFFYSLFINPNVAIILSSFIGMIATQLPALYFYSSGSALNPSPIISELSITFTKDAGSRRRRFDLSFTKSARSRVT